MSNLYQNYYRALGLHIWELRLPDVAASAKRPNPPSPATDLPDWSVLQQTVTQCTACSLHQTRTQTVFGTGNPDADLMLIGEAPGFHEDQQGETLCSRAGQLLTAMIKAMQMERSEVYIANILKCRPPNNRDPLPEEVQTCTPFLDQQIALVKPKVLLAVAESQAIIY